MLRIKAKSIKSYITISLDENDFFWWNRQGWLRLPYYIDSRVTMKRYEYDLSLL